MKQKTKSRKKGKEKLIIRYYEEISAVIVTQRKLQNNLTIYIYIYKNYI